MQVWYEDNDFLAHVPIYRFDPPPTKVNGNLAADFRSGRNQPFPKPAPFCHSWTVIMEGEKFNKQGHVLVVKKSQ